VRVFADARREHGRRGADALRQLRARRSLSFSNDVPGASSVLRSRLSLRDPQRRHP
jgi:hypothetical protein